MDWLPEFLWTPQRRGIEGVIESLKTHQSVCLQSPTGGGKTLCAAMLMRWAESQGKKTVFYVNRKLLLPQTKKAFAIHGLRCGIRAAEWDFEHDDNAPHQIASIQTEYARSVRSGRWSVFPADLVIVDEIHLQKGPMLEAIRERHGCQMIGLSATPIGLKGICEDLVVSGSLQEYRECGAIVPCVVKGIMAPDMRKVKRNLVGEFVINDRTKKVFVQSIVGDVYRELTKVNPDLRPSILFAPGVQGSVYLTEYLRNRGVEWAHVDATYCVVKGKRYNLTPSLWQDLQGQHMDGKVVGVSSRMKCLSLDTQVLTRRGWVGAADYSIDDEVATVNLSDMSVGWESGCRLIRSRSSSFVSVHNSSVDFRVTADHNMVVRTTNGTRKPPNAWKLVEAASLVDSGCKQIPVAAHGKFKGVPLSDSELRCIAWLITDGSVAYGASIVQSLSKPAMHHQHLLASFLEAGIPIRVTGPHQVAGGSDYLRYRVFSADLKASRIYEWLCRDMDERILVDATREQLEVFMRTVVLADGHITKHTHYKQGTYCIFKRRSLLDRLQAACVVRGMRCNITTPQCRESRGKDGQEYGYLYWSPGRDTARIHSKDHGRTGKHVVEMQSGREEDTWCLTTGNGTLITRRNGRVAIVGNCREGIDWPHTYCGLFATPVGSVSSYIQMMGRILRKSKETPDMVVALDFGGNYIRHGSPNAERPWRDWFEMPEGRASSLRENEIREGRLREPVVCPYCFTERHSGSKCPDPPYGCGAEAQLSKRTVVMEDGSLTEVDCGNYIPKHKSRVARDTSKLWAGMFWGYRKHQVDRSFRQMRAAFQYKHGYRPPDNLPYMPLTPEGWYAKPKDVNLSDLIPPEPKTGKDDQGRLF